MWEYVLNPSPGLWVQLYTSVNDLQQQEQTQRIKLGRDCSIHSPQTLKPSLSGHWIMQCSSNRKHAKAAWKELRKKSKFILKTMYQIWKKLVQKSQWQGDVLVLLQVPQARNTGSTSPNRIYMKTVMQLQYLRCTIRTWTYKKLLCTQLHLHPELLHSWHHDHQNLHRCFYRKGSGGKKAQLLFDSITICW